MKKIASSVLSDKYKKSRKKEIKSVKKTISHDGLDITFNYIPSWDDNKIHYQNDEPTIKFLDFKGKDINFDELTNE